MIKKIIIPVDGSELSESAIPKAFEIAGRSPEHTLVVFRDTELPVDSPVISPANLAPARDEEYCKIEAYLASVRERFADLGTQLETKIADVDEGIAETIIRESEKERADFIAMTTHGRTGLNRLFFGSVAERVLRLAPCSVLLVR